MTSWKKAIDCYPPQDRLLTYAEAAMLLGLSPLTIRSMTCRRELPHIKLNGKRTVRYSLRALEALIKREDCNHRFL